MKSWFEIYNDRVSDVYRNYVREQYKPFINEISQLCNGDTRLVEIGSGAGTISKIISEDYKYNELILLDNDIEMILLSYRTMAGTMGYEVYDRDITRVNLSEYIKYLDKTVFHSHGVLEHLTDEDIKKITRSLRYYRVPQVHYVPSNKWEVPSRGDERLMSVTDWNKICNPDDIIEFNEGKDLILLFNT